MSQKFYMHLIDEKAATFDGGTICYARFGQYVRGVQVKLCKDLAQVKSEQSESRSYRAERGWDQMEYSYTIVGLPE